MGESGCTAEAVIALVARLVEVAAPVVLALVGLCKAHRAQKQAGEAADAARDARDRADAVEREQVRMTLQSYVEANAPRVAGSAVAGVEKGG